MTVVDVPPMNFLMMAGEGNPKTSEDYAHAVEALCAVSYALRFMIKRGVNAIGYAVTPLEGLWRGDDVLQNR